MNCIWLDGSKGFKEGMSFSDIDEKTYRLIEEEETNKDNVNFLCMTKRQIAYLPHNEV